MGSEKTVTFVNFGENIASSRLRAKIPQAELAKMGIETGNDVIVYGKHIIENIPKWFKSTVFDICDNHFDSSVVGDYYHRHTNKADYVTCNTEAMQRVIKEKTGRESMVIPDPYESEEQPAGFGDGILWFGHESNLKHIEPYRYLKPRILTGDEWSRTKQLDLLSKCGIVLIPTDKTGFCKSSNRLVESVRNGRFVVAGDDVESYREFSDLMWIGDISSGIEWALGHPAQCIERVKECQERIRDKYSPETIGKHWKDALDMIWQLHPTQH